MPSGREPASSNPEPAVSAPGPPWDGELGPHFTPAKSLIPHRLFRLLAAEPAIPAEQRSVVTLKNRGFPSCFRLAAAVLGRGLNLIYC